jgi:hypothetical protein
LLRLRTVLEVGLMRVVAPFILAAAQVHTAADAPALPRWASPRASSPR